MHCADTRYSVCFSCSAAGDDDSPLHTGDHLCGDAGAGVVQGEVIWDCVR